MVIGATGECVNGGWEPLGLQATGRLESLAPSLATRGHPASTLPWRVGVPHSPASAFVADDRPGLGWPRHCWVSSIQQALNKYSMNGQGRGSGRGLFPPSGLGEAERELEVGETEAWRGRALPKVTCKDRAEPMQTYTSLILHLLPSFHAPEKNTSGILRKSRLSQMTA